MILALSLVLAAAPAFAQPDDWTHRGRKADRLERRWDRWSDGRDRDGVHLRVLRDYYLSANATATEPIVIIGGSATIDGKTDDDVVVIGGTLRVGPKAVIGGDIVTVGGEAIIDPEAQVRGKVDEAVVVWPDFNVDFGWLRSRRGWWPVAAFGATLFRLGLVLTVSLLLTVVAPGWIRSMAVRASSVLSAGLLGAAVEVVFVPALIAVVMVLLISIVGIPLIGAIPVILAAGALVWVGGFAAVAVALGARLRGRSVATSSSPVADLVVGFTAVTALTIIAHFMSLGSAWMGPLGWMVGAAGFALEYVAWTIGLGAALSSLFVRGPVMPPRLPAPTVS
jgi:hypothetical protein